MTSSQRTGAPTGIALRDPWSWGELAELAGTAEETGFASLFLPEITGRDAFATLSALAGESASLELGTGVVTIAARRALTTAMAASTVDERSGGRMVLGIGSGPAGAGALERLARYVRTVRALLDGEEAPAEPGRAAARLSLPPAHRVPIWIAALGPRAMRLAGELADGVLLNWCPPERVAVARDRVREGAERAGRDPDAVSVAVYVRACVGQDEDEAVRALRHAAGEYASIQPYRRQFEAVGLGAEAAAAATAHGEGRPEDVPEALVRSVALLGSASEAAARLDAYRQAGAELPIVYPVPCLDPRSSVLGTIFATAPHPALAP